MAWSLDFEAALHNRAVQLFYVLESVDVGDMAGFGGSLRLSSFHLAGYDNVISKEGSAISYGELRIRSWNCSQMSWSVGLVGDHAADIRSGIRRGQAVRLRVGLSRDLSTFEAVALGTVFNVERTGGRWSIVIRDLAGALISRFTSDRLQASLFYDLPLASLTAAYSPGDGSVFVSFSADFDDDGGGVGAIQIKGDAGNLFFLTYTGKAAGELTGVSAAGQFGTTAEAASIGNDAFGVAYINGTPIEIVRKILVSTGAGTNGSDDVLPKSWGFGIPAEFVADADMTSFQNDINVVGSDAQELLVTVNSIDQIGQPNGKALLDGFLNSAGYFLTSYQGQITCRAAVIPNSQRTSGFIEITDRHIQTLEAYQSHDRSSPAEYSISFVEDAEGNRVSVADTWIQSLPLQPQIFHVLHGLYSANVNHSAIRDGHLDRLSVWDLKVPERIVLTLAGFRGAIPAPGDTIELSTDLLVDREGRAYRNRRGLVIQAGADFFGSSSKLAILFLPTLLQAQPPVILP